MFDVVDSVCFAIEVVDVTEYFTPITISGQHTSVILFFAVAQPNAQPKQHTLFLMNLSLNEQ